MEQTITGNPDSGKLYRIKWVNQARPGMGFSKDTYTKDEAESIAAQLNRLWPTIKHTVERV